MTPEEYTHKEEFEQLMKANTELLEMLKASQNQVDELIDLIMQTYPGIKNNPEIYVRKRNSYIRTNSPFDNLTKEPAIIIHVIPDDFSVDTIGDLNDIDHGEIHRFMNPEHAIGAEYTYNIDGYAVYCSYAETVAYNQIIRNGVYESFRIVERNQDNLAEKYINEAFFKENVCNVIFKGCQALHNKFGSTSFSAYITLNSFKEVLMYRYNSFLTKKFNINNLFLPAIKVSIENSTTDISKLLIKPMSIILQTCGVKG